MRLNIHHLPAIIAWGSIIIGGVIVASQAGVI